MQCLMITRFGGPEVLKLVDEAAPPMQPDGVRVRVAASGVNFADVMMRMGIYPEAPKPPFVPGYEIAGTVTEVGTAVREIRTGDRVVAGIRFGGYATEVVIPEMMVRKIPGKLTEVEAAAVPVNFVTAWVALHEMARVRKGDRVLVPSAAGGVGTAAVQLAAQAGAHVVGVVGSPEKIDTVRALGASETLSRDAWESVSDEEAGGFDVILDSTGGESLRRAFARLARAGRVVSFGASGMIEGRKRSLLRILGQLRDIPIYTPFRLMAEDKGVFGLNLLALMSELKPGGPPNAATRAYDAVFARFADGSLRAVVGKTFPLSQGAEAHQYLQSRASVGKVVLVSKDGHA